MNPRAAADRYRDELARLQDGFAAQAAERERSRAGRAVTARSHRATAQSIRAYIDGVWDQVHPALAPTGVTLLDQLRDDVPEDVPAADPATGEREARDACREARAYAAELRGMSGAGGTVALGLVGASLLALGLGALLHGTKVLPGAACVAAGAILAIVLVAGNRSGGNRPLGRALLLGAGAAGVGVLATTRSLDADPVGILVAVVAIGLAARFAVLPRRQPEPPRRRGRR